MHAASGKIFISHASADDEFVRALRLALEGQGLSVWVDSRDLRGGDQLDPEIRLAIQEAGGVIVVLSPNTVNSAWVRREIEVAEQTAAKRTDDYRIIPILLPGIEPAALGLWFAKEPVAVPIRLDPTGLAGLAEALPGLIAALGLELPRDRTPQKPPEPVPMEELVLELVDPAIDTAGGLRRATALARLVYTPADPAARGVEGRRYRFTAPLGPIEAERLRWYLERYHLWPTGRFKLQAEEIEAKLPEWGKLLFDAALASDEARPALAAWQAAAPQAERRFSVLVDSDLPEGSPEAQQAAARVAASELFSLPWELLHDDRGFLFHGRRAVRVRRRLPQRHAAEVLVRDLPIRVLLVSPRPEDERAGYIDHRASARPLVEALEPLGELVQLTLLSPPTFPAMVEALDRAVKSNEPFDIVHFDGHGVYDPKLGLGCLCFEDPNDAEKLDDRRSKLIDAGEIGEAMREYRIPLVFLDACQTATAETSPTASVAATILGAGVASVVAMSHSVLVETARRFVEAFYRRLAEGHRVGQAMLAGQRTLQGDPTRGRIMGAGQLELQDWFVPVLYQEAADPPLSPGRPAADVQYLQDRQRRLSLGRLPEPPRHTFVGRSRQMLALERLLDKNPYAVICGSGGSGKTTLAVELARWISRTGRCRRVAFVQLDACDDLRSVIDSLGQQLLPEAEHYSVAQFPNLDAAMQPIRRALMDRPTLVVLDNLESILPKMGTAKMGTAKMGTGSAGACPLFRGCPHFRGDAEEGQAGTGSAGACPLFRGCPPFRGDAEEGQAGTGSAGACPLFRGCPHFHAELFAFCQALLEPNRATRLLFTSREALPAPFDSGRATRHLGALDQREAIELVGQVLTEAGLEPALADPGSDPQEIVDLVEAVQCHARALVLLAPDLARQGVRATTENVRGLMAEMDRKHPGDRENSLYASVELSLRRLSPATRQQARALAVFHGGAHPDVLGATLGIEPEAAKRLLAEVIEVGLGTDMGYGHVRLDPALPPYLLRELEEAERARLTAAWAHGMEALSGFLYEEQFRDAHLSAQLTLLELPNLLAWLERLEATADAEELVQGAGRIEHMVAHLGRPQALARAVAARQRATERLGSWSQARFNASGQAAERLLESGDLSAALTAAQDLLKRSTEAGEMAYPGAAYDLAMAHCLLGRVLCSGGAAEAALSRFSEAERRFQVLADAGNREAEQMASVAITERGDCLRALGRLDEAAAAYEEAIRRDEKRGSDRDVAAGKFQLGTVRMLQGRYGEALRAYKEARQTFEALGEPASVATAWHQIGRVHRQAGNYDEAEQAYRQSLAIRVRSKNRPGEAASLGELGNLYGAMGRLEDAAAFSRQAKELYRQLGDAAREGACCNNLADTLIKLRHYDDARGELLRAIECRRPYGHAAEPWKTWNILCDLERACGNPDAARGARQKAIESFRDYRRAGGENHLPGARLCREIGEAIRSRQLDPARALLAQLRDDPQSLPAFHLLISKLEAVLAGSREGVLAADPDLRYDDAVELELLLEGLGKPNAGE